MQNENKPKIYFYWKYSWQKRLILIGGILQIIVLFLNIQNFYEILLVKDKIFSSTQWDIYVAEQSFNCVINAFLAGILLGIFFIGIYSKNEKIAGKAEVILLFIFALILVIIGFILKWNTVYEIKIRWFVLLIATLSGAFYIMWKLKNMKSYND